MSSALYFAGSRVLSESRLVEIDGTSVVESFARLAQSVEAKCGETVASLFAEPVLSRGNGEAPARIDWYSRREGVPRVISDLDPGTRGIVERKLAERLGAIRAITGDPEIGPLVAAALNLIGPSSLMAIGDEPILLDWGLVPAGLQEGAAADRHFASTIGAFLPGFATPPMSRAEWNIRFRLREPAQGTARTQKPDAASPPSASAPPPPAASSLDVVPVPGWRAPLVASGLTGLVLLLTLVPGVLRFPNLAPDEERVAAARALDASVIGELQRRKAALEELLKGACSAVTGRDAATLLPPPAQRTIIGPPGVLAPPPPAPPEREGAPPEEIKPPPSISPATGQPETPMMLPNRLIRGVALVIAGRGSGTGFFISPTLLVTNRHVVTTHSRVKVASGVTGLIDGEVIKVGGEDDLEDFALVRVASQANAMPFAVSTRPRLSEAVTAAGFPSLYMQTDPTYQRLMGGDASAARNLTPVLTEGKVNHVQQHTDITLVLHGAEIAPGNSGGPLVDACGRVLGVNTFGITDKRMPVTARYALGSDGLIRFLASAGVTLAPVTEGCEPRAVPPASASAPAPAAAPATPAPAATTPAVPSRPATPPTAPPRSSATPGTPGGKAP